MTILLAILASASAAQPATPVDRPRTFLSPMGQPFRPRGPGDDPLADWFAGADANHDGSLTLAEFTADADRFFGLLDINHDGIVDDSEINRYETVVAPESQNDWSPRQRPASADSGTGASSGGEPARHGHGGRGGFGGGRFGGEMDDPFHGLEGAGRFSFLNIPEPVVAADVDMNRRITPAKFEDAATERFALLDQDHSGRLTLDALRAMLPAIDLPPGHRKAHGGGDASR